MKEAVEGWQEMEGKEKVVWVVDEAYGTSLSLKACTTRGC